MGPKWSLTPTPEARPMRKACRTWEEAQRACASAPESPALAVHCCANVWAASGGPAQAGHVLSRPSFENLSVILTSWACVTSVWPCTAQLPLLLIAGQVQCGDGVSGQNLHFDELVSEKFLERPVNSQKRISIV